MSVQKMEILNRKNALQKVFFEEITKLTKLFVVYFRTRNSSRCLFEACNEQITSCAVIKTLGKLCESITINHTVDTSKEQPQPSSNDESTTDEESSQTPNSVVTFRTSKSKKDLYKFLSLDKDDDSFQEITILRRI